MFPSLRGVSVPEENKNATRTTVANAPIEINAFLSLFPSDAKLTNEKNRVNITVIARTNKAKYTINETTPYLPYKLAFNLIASSPWHFFRKFVK